MILLFYSLIVIYTMHLHSFVLLKSVGMLLFLYQNSTFRTTALLFTYLVIYQEVAVA